ncbi:hypothetical protein C2S51_038098 [Perilla frutescens var. frutescens]|nr:hypothetical protein C2S51_038098 [Perilla frutescens var. frutescens]
MPVIGSLTTLYNPVANLHSIDFRTEDARSLLLNPMSRHKDEWPNIGEVYTDMTASFIISDDLKVMPNVESSIINTLSNFGFAITDMVGAKTYNVNFGYNEIMALLRVSLISRNPLTALLFCESTMNITAGQENALKNQIGKKAIFLNSKKMILKAQHDFISFLFSMLTIPLGRVGWYLHSNTGLRTVDNLHRSTVNLLNNHLMSPEAKDLLFKPDVPTSDYSDNEFVPLNFDPCMSQYLVRGSRTYMVRKDLTVAPLGITSGLSVINGLKISLFDVEEVELRVGFQKGLSIMKAALTSTTALTDCLIKPMLKKQPNQEN